MAVGAVQVCCPECEADVPIATEITSMQVEGSDLIIRIEPDLTDVITHAWAHDL
jgi:hypothetical protein